MRYKVLLNTFPDPLVFCDSRSYAEILDLWINKRQILDKLEDEYTTKVDNYLCALDRNETLGHQNITVERPGKVTITDDILLQFNGDSNGKYAGSVLVGMVAGIQVIE